MTDRRIPPSSEYPLVNLTNSSGLLASFYPDGRLFGFRFGDLMLNQILPTPGERALTRLYVRDRNSPEETVAVLGPPLTGDSAPLDGIRFERAGERSAILRLETPVYAIRAEIQLHEEKSAWRWRVHVTNRSGETRRIDALYGQDLGLGSEGGVRMNEAYDSQYLDHRMARDERFGPAILTRQNQSQGGRFPWIAQGCWNGAASWSTDGFQFFGVSHRLTGRPRALDEARLPDENLQYEIAYPSFQAPEIELAPGESAEFAFFAVFQPDHPKASGEDDLPLVREILESWPESSAPVEAVSVRDARSSFETPLLSGEELIENEARALFPGEIRHMERDEAGRWLSFFAEDGRHVVSRRKELLVERPHRHILRSGDSLWLSDDLLGTTVEMSGIFNAQIFLGNTNLARFLSVIRDPLSLMRSSGQRVFVKSADGWHQLGIPSLFEMSLRSARWIYRFESGTIELTTRADDASPRIDLEIRVLSGDPRSFLISHLLLMGDNEMSQPVSVRIDESSGRVECRPEPNSLLGERWPEIRFSISAEPGLIARISGDEALFSDGVSRNGPFIVFETRETTRFALTLSGENPAAALAPSPARHRSVLPRLVHSDDAAGRIGDLLPWFAHDAWIHFTAPHGLEQYGGAAWGTRDVCQGPAEWLLSIREYGAVRDILLKVFEQQYEAEGNWPQWFMFDPFRFIQSVESHGDIVFWPLKALCDYVEASGDFSLLREETPYTDPKGFVPTAHRAPITEHVEKILANFESRLLPGTALVNYGDGDWDDTLQPSDPRLRSKMASAWTVGLAYDALRRYRDVCERAGLAETAGRLEETLSRIRADFRRWMMPEGIVAGFAVFEEDGPRYLLHPTDSMTGIRYRLLPMTRGVLSELLTPEEARAHFEIIREHLSFPDGVRLMSDPIPYRGGEERWFKRAETAANFGREIGLMYSHAHLRYAEALAKLGDADGLWRALRTVNPIGLKAAVPNAEPRQANVYFTSSDGAFKDRYEAGTRFGELRDGRVPVKGGWRLYSSGPGLFIRRVVADALGLRESFGDVVIDPVLPRDLDGLIVRWVWNEKPLEVRYRVQRRNYAPHRIALNGEELRIDRRVENPYREGGARIEGESFASWLREDANSLEIEM